jgi:response regulator of citrate/malate metabolism
MINCIIIEDEPLAVDILEDYISKTDYLKLQHKFEHLSEAWNEIEASKGILIFLDTNSRGQKITSTEVLQILHYGHKIIFETAYPKNYPVIKDVLTNSGIGYLGKPFSFRNFKKEVERILN